MTNHYQLSLFDPSQFEKRKTVLQQEFEDENIDFLMAVKDYIFESLEDLHTKIFTLFKFGEMDCRLPAVGMVSFIRKRIINSYAIYCKNATTGRFKLTTASNDHVYIKKLNDKGMPSNIETVANNMIMFQVTENSKDKGCNVFIGYTCPDDYSQIDEVLAVCIEGDKVIWKINLLDLGNQAIVIDNLPKGGKPILKEGTVKLKKIDKKE